MISADEFRRREAAVMSENDLLSKVRGLAATLGWLVYHTHDSRRSEPGFPDLVLVHGARLLYRELKTAKGKVTPEQAAWLGALSDARADVGIWRPMDLYDGTIRDVLTDGRDPATIERLLVITRSQGTRRAALIRKPAAAT